MASITFNSFDTILILHLSVSPAIFSILSFFVHRHLDSSSNERPDISSLQRRIKVYFFIQTEAVRCALTILSVTSCYCSEKSISMRKRNYNVYIMCNNL